MTSPPPAIPDEDYEAIEAAVMETARGRWFLAEFARRNRSADTAVLLAAIERLEKLIGTDAVHTDAKPHAPINTGIATSAAAELFAIERHPPVSQIPTAGLPDDGDATWIIEDRKPLPLPGAVEVVEIDADDSLVWSASEKATPPAAEKPRLALLTAPPAGPEPATPEASAPTAEKPVSAQDRMLSATLAAAQETVARTADTPPVSHTPPSVDPTTLDTLSFEEKTVYFG